MRVLPEIKCINCGKLLAKGVYSVLSIKCRGCKEINVFQSSAASATPERRRAPDLGVVDGSCY